MINKEQKARELFLGDYNCAQSTLSVFADDLKIDAGKTMAISSGFGAGIGYQGRTCGAVTGACMALGLHSGNLFDQPEMVKENTYQLVKAFNKKFEEKFGTTICKELIGVGLSTKEGVEQGKQAGVFETKCPEFVATAVNLVSLLTKKQV